jgi:hypothetical protein
MPVTAMPETTPAPRLHLLQARSADVAVVFRRGPSKWVEVVRWDTARDGLARGHWFHGRIYERRSDLSPDGELLVYFASKYSGRTLADREYTATWTAVSRPPWLTALALWPKGDCWWGGGLFLGERRLLLNHRPAEAEPHPSHRPRGLHVEANPEARGENDPLFSRRLDRDGWDVRQRRELEWRGLPLGYETVRPELRARAHPRLAWRVVMERRLDGLRYRELFRVEGPAGPVALPHGRVDWVDWDRGGRLVLLGEAGIQVAPVTSEGVGAFHTLLDLRADRPESREPPPAAREWP